MKIMNGKSSHLTKAAFLAAGVSLLQLTSSAGTALTFGPSDSLVKYDTSFEREAETVSTNPITQVADFSADQPLLSESENYKGPSIYGGYEFSTTTNDAFLSRQQIRHRKNKPDSISLQSYSGSAWGGNEISLHAVFFFKQEDFKDEFASGNFTPDSLSTKWSSYFKGDNRDITGRFLVKMGETYYLSNYTFNATNSGSSMLPKVSLEKVLWAPYSPTDNLNFDQDAANFQKIELANVEAAGVYIEDDQWIGNDSASSPYSLEISEFKVSGVIADK